MRRIAVNKMGDALAGGGTVFAADDKPELVKSAVPFSLKLMESLLAESPKHKGLLFATASGFTQYAFAFVQQEAEKIEDRDVAAALEMRRRARRLYLRARDYGLRGLEAAHPGFTAQLRHDPKAAVRVLKTEDVPLAYCGLIDAMRGSQGRSGIRPYRDLGTALFRVQLEFEPEHPCKPPITSFKRSSAFFSSWVFTSFISGASAII